MENKEKFEQLMQEEDFITKLLELQTPEEVYEEFKTNGVTLTMDEVKEVIKELDTIVNCISEEDLENISGGDDNPLTPLDKQNKFVGKFYEKLGEGAANMIWIIPTIAVTGVVTTVVQHYLKKGLEKKDKKQ